MSFQNPHTPSSTWIMCRKFERWDDVYVWIYISMNYFLFVSQVTVRFETADNLSCLWLKIYSKKRRYSWRNISIPLSVSFLPHFVSRNFFQGLLKNFQWTSRTCSRYLKGLPNLAKIWDFQKMKLKMGLEYSDKSSCFELKLFFKGL